MRLICVAVVVGLLPACRTAEPVVDFEADRVEGRGTITGTVRGPEDGSPLASRRVEAVEQTTNRRYAVETNATGGFTFLIPPGTYRLEVALVPGETVLSEPGPIELGSGDIDSHKEIVVGAPPAPTTPPSA
jgi:hypothetical protein